MCSLVSACRRLGVLACLGALSLSALGQDRFALDGGEYPIVGTLAGDQVYPQIALNPFGGYLVWQDNATDGDGYGISARHINRSLSGSLGVFRVNENGAGDQISPQVALLTTGGAVFTWQSVVQNHSKVYARFLKPDGTFATGDIAVSDYTGDQITPVVAALPDGSALLVWASSGQDSSMLGIFGARFSPTGQKLGNEFQINQTVLYNQRTPAICGLPNGNVVVAWISEKYRGTTQNADATGRIPDPSAGLLVYDIDVYGRIYQPNGTAVAGEFKINSDPTICADPSLSASSDGFLVSWTGKANQVGVTAQLSDGWDIFARPFNVDGTPKRADFKVNSFTYGDQYASKSAFLNGFHIVLWTSLGQDGSKEGVVARLVLPGGDFMSTEFRVNTTTASSQMHPIVTSTGGQDFLCVWTSFVGGVGSFDLYAQRYATSPGIGAPPAPFVSALSQTRMSVTWPELAGYTGVQYQVYVDQNSTPVTVSGNEYTATGLAAGTSHSFRLAYQLSDGSQSAVSDPATGRTWGEDNNFDGLPDDWQALYWGSDSSKWPSANADSDGDGATNLQEFLAGTNPTDANSVLRMRMTSSPQGWRLEWNTQPGLIYQVQIADAGLSWSNLGSARFAAGNSDSIPITGDTNLGLYRVIRVR